MPPKHKLGETQGQSNSVDLRLVAKDIDFIKTELTDLKNNNAEEHKAIRELIDSKYVTKEEFQPYKKGLDYTFYIFLGAVLTALATLIIRSQR